MRSLARAAATPAGVDAPEDEESRRLVAFALVLIANLLVIGGLLVLWNIKSASEVSGDHPATRAKRARVGCRRI